MIDQIKTFEIEGPKLLSLKLFRDERGFFTERYRESFCEILGLKKDSHTQSYFVQDNYSYSKKGVIRGLHLQHSPGQGKLVTCLHGEILDIAVDMRHKSPTFGKHLAIRLSSQEPALFWIPFGFAHGFSVQSLEAGVLYKVTSYFDPQKEVGIKWNDCDLAINWQIQNPIVSAKDNLLQSFSNYKKNPVF